MDSTTSPSDRQPPGYLPITDFAAVPDRLKSRPQWVLALAGVPCLPIGSFRHPASLTTPAHWKNFNAALAARQKWAEPPSLGYVATEGDIAADLDQLERAGVHVFGRPDPPPVVDDLVVEPDTPIGDLAPEVTFPPKRKGGRHEVSG
jgi:hypothetical protein